MRINIRSKLQKKKQRWLYIGRDDVCSCLNPPKNVFKPIVRGACQHPRVSRPDRLKMSVSVVKRILPYPVRKGSVKRRREPLSLCYAGPQKGQHNLDSMPISSSTTYIYIYIYTHIYPGHCLNLFLRIKYKCRKATATGENKLDNVSLFLDSEMGCWHITAGCVPQAARSVCTNGLYSFPTNMLSFLFSLLILSLSLSFSLSLSYPAPLF